MAWKTFLKNFPSPPQLEKQTGSWTGQLKEENQDKWRGQYQGPSVWGLENQAEVWEHDEGSESAAGEGVIVVQRRIQDTGRWKPHLISEQIKDGSNSSMKNRIGLMFA